MKVQTYEEIYGKRLTVRDIVDGFFEDTKSGQVLAFGGKLNVRPPYQREFVYGDEKRNAVVSTIMSGYPLNVMYWAKTENGYELMDGQQRTISFCKYGIGQFSIDIEHAGKKSPKTFDGLTMADKAKFLNYPITVYICDGDDREKLEWFQIINIAGLELTAQEMRNAIYSCPWTIDAKRYFSKINGEGYGSEGHISNGHMYKDYLNVSGGAHSEKKDAVVRQKLLEIVLKWAVDAYNRKYGRKISIEDYMESKIKEPDAKELWRYYEDVMEWVKTTFPTYRKEMIGVEWGLLYNQYHDNTPVAADKMANDLFDNYITEISDPKGVYEAVLSQKAKYIHTRTFDKRDMDQKYKEQKGICPYCHRHFEREDMQGDHIKPWSKGGITEKENLQMLCAECNGKKSGYDTGYSPWDEKEYAPFNIEKWDSNANSK